MRALLVMLALTGCRQVFGIPPGGQVEGEQSGFAIQATVSGALGSRGGAAVMLNDNLEPLADGPFTFQTRLADGATFSIVPLAAQGMCHVTNGEGVIEGADASGVEIRCEGLAAIGTLFSAPIDPLDPGVDTQMAKGSIITQETSLTPAPLNMEGHVTEVTFETMPMSPPYGRFPFIPTSEFGAKLDGAGYSRSYTIDPSVVAPETYGFGKPSMTESGAAFGAAVALSGDTLVVGAPDQGTGRAFVFHRVGREWIEDQVLDGSRPGERFGASVAIAGDKLVVGAPGDDTMTGAAYEFARAAAVWMPTATLTAPGGVLGDELGAAVAINATTTIVGAPNCRGTELPPALPSGCVFEFGATTTAHRDSNPGDRFGAAVATSGSLLVVGAPEDDSGIPGNRTDTSRPDAGAVYIYTLGGTTPTYLKAASPGAGDQFGAAVAIDGTLVVIGAPLEDSAVTIDGSDPEDNSANAAGAAYVFQFVVAWQQVAFVKAPNADVGDNFGYSVAIQRNTVPGHAPTCVVAIGAPFEDSASAGDPASEGAPDAGAVYAFRLDVTTGQPDTAAYTKASTIGSGDAFGLSVALTPETLVAGSPFEDSSVSGWNQHGNEALLDAGAVFAIR
jgi:hypothetical protein